LLALFLLCGSAGHAWAQEIITLPTRLDSTQSFFIAALPQNPQAIALLFPGASGRIRLRQDNGKIKFGPNNFRSEAGPNLLSAESLRSSWTRRRIIRVAASPMRFVWERTT
jgi:hypothetical protein